MRSLAEGLLLSSGALDAYAARGRALRDMRAVEESAALHSSPAVLAHLAEARSRVSLADHAARLAAGKVAVELPPLFIAMSVAELVIAVHVATGLGHEHKVRDGLCDRLEALVKYLVELWIPGLDNRPLIEVLDAAREEGALGESERMGWAPVSPGVLATHVWRALDNDAFRAASAELRRETSEFERANQELRAVQESFFRRLVTMTADIKELERTADREQTELELASHEVCAQIVKAFDVYPPAGVAFRASAAIAVLRHPIGASQLAISAMGHVVERAPSWPRALFLGVVRGLRDAANLAFDGLVDLLEQKVGADLASPYRAAGRSDDDNPDNLEPSVETPAEAELNRALDARGIRQHIELGVARASVLALLLQNRKRRDGVSSAASLVSQVFSTPMNEVGIYTRARWLVAVLRLQGDWTRQMVREVSLTFPVLRLGDALLTLEQATNVASSPAERDVVVQWVGAFDHAVKVMHELCSGAPATTWDLAREVAERLQRPPQLLDDGPEAARAVGRVVESLRATPFLAHLQRGEALRHAPGPSWFGEGAFADAAQLLDAAVAREPVLSLLYDLQKLRPTPAQLATVYTFPHEWIRTQLRQWTARATALFGAMPSPDELLERYALRCFNRATNS